MRYVILKVFVLNMDCWRMLPVFMAFDLIIVFNGHISEVFHGLTHINVCTVNFVKIINLTGVGRN